MPEHKVFLVDDHHLVRAGLRSLIDDFADFTVVGEAADGDEAVAAILAIEPTVVLADLVMKRMDGLALVKRLHSECPAIRALILSMHGTQELIVQALRSGAYGYLTKDALVAELELALQAVVRGERNLGGQAAGLLIDRVLELHSSAPGADKSHPLAPLTARQTGILRLIAQGKSSKEIAFQLGLSPKTVDAHRAQIMRRLGRNDLAGLVRLAIESGLG